MPTVTQVKSLIRSHFSPNPEAFATLVLQIAAQEASQGHRTLAVELRDLLNQQRKNTSSTSEYSFPQSMAEFVFCEYPDVTMAQLVVPSSLQKRLERIMVEFRQREKLSENGLRHRRRLLFNGPPGTGKTMTARILAHELHLPLFTVQMDKILSRYLGESSSHLHQIFDFIKTNIGVYLFDEFDSIGGERGNDNDIGEMRRILNAFLAFVDQDKSNSLLIAATNNPRLLDQALCRRFDDVLFFPLPDAPLCKAILQNLLSMYVQQPFDWDKLVAKCSGLSQAEITLACQDAVKEMILADQEWLVESDVVSAIEYRNEARSVLRKG